jgi:hypothetical protein
MIIVGPYELGGGSGGRDGAMQGTEVEVEEESHCARRENGQIAASTFHSLRTGPIMRVPGGR